MAKLTVTKVKALSKPGKYADGAGLYLIVKPTGTKSWVLRYTLNGRRPEMGLGGFPDVTLARARALAALRRVELTEGRDPLAEKRRGDAPTFAAAARETHEVKKPRWRNKRHRDDWLRSLELYAFPVMGETPVDAITRVDVLDCLMPIWKAAKRDRAQRVRTRIRAVMKWAVAHGYREDNPAGEVIDGAIPAMPTAQQEHYRALPYPDVPAALEMVDASKASIASRACFRFLVLTAARSGEARGARWSEIDREAREWRIPGERMKAGIEHRVPLTDAALAVLDRVWPLRDESGLVFPSPKGNGAALSDMTLTKLLRSNGLAERTTVHGFRSAFRDWAGERTNAPWAVMEHALAHQVGSSVERAYARSDLLEKRRELMSQWAAYCARQPGKVVKLHA